MLFHHLQVIRWSGLIYNFRNNSKGFQLFRQKPKTGSPVSSDKNFINIHSALLSQICLQHIFRRCLCRVLTQHQRDLLIRAAGKGNKPGFQASILQFSLHIAMGSHIFPVHRFQCPCISSFVRNQDLRLMEMPQCNIIKACTGYCPHIYRNMLCISPMSQQNMDSFLCPWTGRIIKGFLYFLVFIAEPINIDIQFLILHTG